MGEFLRALSEIKYSKLLVALCAISSAVCPGLLILYIYKHNLFTDTSLGKLLLLSVAISLPLFLWNTMLVELFETKIRKEIGEALNITEEVSEEDLRFYVARGSTLTMVLVNAVLFVFWYFQWPFRNFAVTVFVLEILATITAFGSFWRRFRGRRP